MTFSSVLWIATGSGIASVLPHLLARPNNSHLLWITRSPRDTYGDALVDEIEGAPASALIWDTTVNGNPDVAGLARQMFGHVHIEATVCISNRSATRIVVHDLSARGIPSFGAIWDS